MLRRLLKKFSRSNGQNGSAPKAPMTEEDTGVRVIRTMDESIERMKRVSEQQDKVITLTEQLRKKRHAAPAT
jgi:hypothetical protein